jgi:hypothetical protein
MHSEKSPVSKFSSSTLVPFFNLELVRKITPTKNIIAISNNGTDNTLSRILNIAGLWGINN